MRVGSSVLPWFSLEEIPRAMIRETAPSMRAVECECF
jgi:hypothetical protein